MIERLFDPAPFSDKHRKPRDERAKAKRRTPPVTEVVVGDVWKILANGRGCHAVRLASPNRTYCNLVVGGSLTVPFGTKAAGCQECLLRGAPESRGAA